MATTSIQWTDATVNPIRARNLETGAVGHFCEKVSPGCAGCYASAWNERVRPSGKHLIGTGLAFDVRNRNQVEFFLDDAKLLEVVKRRQPTKWFWCDMTDMFGEWVPDEWIDRCFAVMALTPQHTHQVLTKRADRLQTYMEFRSRPPGTTTTQDVLIAYARELGVDASKAIRVIGLSPWPLPNVWLGVSAEDQPRFDERKFDLVDTPAAVRFLSLEPLLGPIELSFDSFGYEHLRRHGRAVDWVIVGGESGPGARPMDLAWARSIVQQCQAAGVACFVKQLGACIAWPPAAGVDAGFINLTFRHSRQDDTPYGYQLCDRKGGDPSEWPEDLRVRQFPESPQQRAQGR